MSDPFVAEIRIFPFNFAPRGWALCDGQVLSIFQNTALFSLLGTTYGGDGKSTFALPDFNGRAPMHPDQGPGLSLHHLGEKGGSETVTLLPSEIPAHSHTMRINSNIRGDSNSPENRFFAGSEFPGASLFSTTAPGDASLNTVASGSSQPHNNMQPYLTLSFCIALQGIYPPRT